MTTEEPLQRRFGKVKEKHVKDEFQLASLTAHKVWLPKTWPSGLGRPKYSLMAIEDRTWWEASCSVTRGGQYRSMVVSGHALTKRPEREPSLVAGLPWPAWVMRFGWKGTSWNAVSDETDTVETVSYQLSVVLDGTFVTVFGHGQELTDLATVAASLVPVSPTRS